MRAALRCRYQVHVTLGDGRATIGRPDKCPVDGFVVAGQASRKRLRGQGLTTADLFEQVLLKPTFVLPLDLFFRLFDLQADFQPGTQDSLGLEPL